MFLVSILCSHFFFFFLVWGTTTKSDRASLVGDAIEYIKELIRTVNELKILVEKNRCGRERSKTE